MRKRERVRVGEILSTVKTVLYVCMYVCMYVS